MNDKTITIQRLTVITPHYPSPRFLGSGAFVERLVRQWSTRGVATTVIAPESIPYVIRSYARKPTATEVAGISVRRPKYMSYGDQTHGVINRYRLTRRAFVRAALRSTRSSQSAEVYYGKFLFRGGEAALAAGRKYDRPACADLGESWSFLRLERSTRYEATQTIRGLSGIVCVSERLHDEVVELGADPKRVIVAPNDVDLKRFRPLDSSSVRKQLGLPLDRKIVIFTGSFVERKGPLRVAEALQRLGPEYGGVFLGRGKQQPFGDQVLFSGSVPNEEVPLWLNAADLFVLPTLREGHCNAINEAIACGLPVVSSDIEDVRGQVDSSFGLLVDPEEPTAIAEGIAALCEDEGRLRAMSQAASRIAHDPERRGRAAAILGFLQTLV